MTQQPPPRPIEDNTLAVVNWLGLRLTKRQDGYSTLCPIHRDSNPSFHIYIRDGKDEGWYCFGCGMGGDATALLAAILKISYQEALQYIVSEATGSVLKQKVKSNSLDTPVLNDFVQVNALLRVVRDKIPTATWLKLVQCVDDGMLIVDQNVASLYLKQIESILKEWVRRI